MTCPECGQVVPIRQLAAHMTDVHADRRLESVRDCARRVVALVDEARHDPFEHVPSRIRQAVEELRRALDRET